MNRLVQAAPVAATLLLAPIVAAAQTQCSLVPGGTTPPTQTDLAVGSSLPSPNILVTPPVANPALPLAAFPARDIAQLPALANVAKQGVQIYEVPSPPELAGIRTAFGVTGTHFQVFYIVAGGRAVIRGIAQDADGNNLTLSQINAIPGVVPTVEIRDGAALVDGSLVKTAAAANYGVWGQEGAPKVFMFMDPLCSFSLRAMQMLKPAIDRGQLQVALIPIAVTDDETGNRSTPAAKMMLSVEPKADMGQDWLRDWSAWASNQSPTPAQAAEQLQANEAAARAIHLRGTPTFVWTKKDGSEGRLDGAPDNLQAFLASLGS